MMMAESRADESKRWVLNKSFVPFEGQRFRSNSGGFERERKVGFGSSGGADSDNWNKKKGEINIGNEISEKSESVGGGRPRLMLQPWSLLVSKEGGGFVNVVKLKGPNPFREARPREQVLVKKEQDWKKIDKQLENYKSVPFP
ncbi:hypothetical protein RJT34_26600 [Clitoria ternatea]|uniref:Uncharacterized protein n=1 Tax=Clitoria ternatea TaxID=43366 RepID=A0AAN9FBN2_CLITE